MKTRKKISAKLLAIMLIAALLLPLAWNVPVEAAEQNRSMFCSAMIHIRI